MRRLALAAAIALALALPGAAPPRARAQTDSLESTRQQVKAQSQLEAAKRRELEDIRRQAAESHAAASRLKGQENAVLAQLRRIERDLGVTRRRLRALEDKRRVLDRQLASTQITLAESVVSLDQQRARLARRLRNLYKFGAERELEFLLSTRSFAQLLARWDFLVRVAEQDRHLLEDIGARQAQVQETKQELESNLSQLQKNARATETQNRKLANLREQRRTSVETIRTQREAYEAAAAELDNTARSLQRLLADLERRRKAESDRALAQGRNPQPYTGDFARGRGQIEWPVHGPVIGHFGPEKHPRFGTTTLNNGIDIQATAGTPVLAAGRGRVDYTSEDYGTFGEIVVLNHGDGYYTLYGHLSEILVAQGQEVQSGQVVGRVGDTGTSLKGTVLHFEVRKGGAALNPEDWLK
ncbi:MAG TPA: peptidoglycan DD-metalloendopeptidase family protein [Candidatus Eisenbacteria bacterium]